MQLVAQSYSSKERRRGILITFQKRKLLVAVIHSLKNFDASTVSLCRLILLGQLRFDTQVKPNWSPFCNWQHSSINFIFCITPCVMLTLFSTNLLYSLTFSKIENPRYTWLSITLDIKGRVCANINKSSSDDDNLSTYQCVWTHQRSIPNLHEFVIHGSQKIQSLCNLISSFSP